MSRPTSGGCVYVNVADGKAYFRAQMNFRGKRFAKNSKCRAEVEQWLYQKRRELGIGPALPKVAFKPENAPSGSIMFFDCFFYFFDGSAYEVTKRFLLVKVIIVKGAGIMPDIKFPRKSRGGALMDNYFIAQVGKV